MSNKQKLDYTGIETNINKRWESGTDHHPKSVEFRWHVYEVEKLSGEDHGLDFGGDGDNGETVLFLLDIFFEAQDKKSNGNT